MSISNVVSFFRHIQDDKELQHQFQNEFYDHGKISVEHVLASAEAEGMLFTIRELRAAVTGQGDELDNKQLDDVVGGAFDIRSLLVKSFQDTSRN